MHDNVELNTVSVKVKDTPSIEVLTPVSSTDVVETASTVEVLTNEFILSSNGVYSSGGGHVGDTPGWLSDAIEAEVSTNNTDLSLLVAQTRDWLAVVEDGVNQDIIRIDDANSVQDGLITTIQSTSDDDRATMYSEVGTKVTETEARAYSTEIFQTEFNGTVGATTTLATIIDTVGTTSSEVDAHTVSIGLMESSITDNAGNLQANATVLDTAFTNVGINPDGTLHASAGKLLELKASIDDVDVRLITEENVSVGTHIWNEVETLRIGMRKEEPTGTWYTYMGGILGWTLDTQLDSSDAQGVADEAHVWAGGASSFVTGDNGEITGWNYADGSAGASTFIVSADSFQIKDPDDSTQILYDAGEFKTFNVAGDYSVLSAGDLSFYKVGTDVPFKYLRAIEAGEALNGSFINISGFYDRTPQIMVSAKEIISFSYPHSGNTQQMKFFPSDVSGNPTTGEWVFKVNAYANLPENTSSYVGTLDIETSPCGVHTYHDRVSYSYYKYSDIHVVSNSGATSIDFTFSIDFASNSYHESSEDSYDDKTIDYKIYTLLEGYNGSDWVTAVNYTLKASYTEQSPNTDISLNNVKYLNIPNNFEAFRLRIRTYVYNCSYSSYLTTAAWECTGLHSLEFEDVYHYTSKTNIYNSTVTEYATSTTFTDTSGILNWLALG